MKALNITGQKFGRLTALARVGSTKQGVRWACACDCGKLHEVTAKLLVRGDAQSCGCLAHEAFRDSRNKHHTHGMTKTSEYSTWRTMHARCENPKNISYPYYGAKGVRVCARWDSFENFLADMGRKPRHGMSIDRLDSSKDYSPDNCRWATIQQQNVNRSGVRLVTFNGVTQSVAEWVRALGVSRCTVYARINHKGMSPLAALGLERL